MYRILICGILIFWLPGMVSAADDAFVLPLESAHWQGEITPRQTVDKATGTACLEYSEHNPQKAAVFYLDVPDPSPDRYDALEFRWQLGAADADVAVSIEGYSENRLRHYHLRKRPNPLGQWQKVFLSLRQDDDGALLRPDEDLKKGKLRIKFQVSIRDLEGVKDPKLLFRFTPPNLVRYPVRLLGDYGAVETFRESGRVGQRYRLTLQNRTGDLQKVRLEAETGRLGEFELKFPSSLELAAEESRDIQVEIFTTEEKARQLLPLAFGQATLFISAEQYPDLKSTWFDSYFINRLIGAIPPGRKGAPRFVSEKQRQRALHKIENDPKSKLIFDEMRKRADAWLERSIVLPKLFHGYAGYYVCKEHNSRLTYLKEGSHWCVKGKHVIEGNEKVDRAGDYVQHAALTEAALDLARMGWLTRDARYSQKAAEILLAYSKIYSGLPFADDASAGFHSRVASVVLGECWWFDPVPAAFDLVRGAEVLSAEEDRGIVEGLILPAVMAIRTQRIQANQQAEINHAVGMGALVAENWPLAAEALDGEMGVRFQLNEDFDADGMTIERDIPYHFAAIKPFVQMAQAYEALGANVFDERFRRLFEAPIAYAPDQLVGAPAGLYEPALAIWNEAAFAKQVAFYRRKGGGWASLLSPVEQVDETKMRVSNSTLNAAGYTTLRLERKNGGLFTAMVNFGSPAWRGGRSLLDPQIIWNKIPLNQRIQRIGYGYEGSGFSHTPAAGNSLLVDGQGGSMLRADQDAVLDSPFPAGRWTSPLERPLFKEVQWSRALALCGETAVMLDTFGGNQTHRFDLIVYLPGPVAETSPSPVKDYPGLLGEGDGYAFYRSPQQVMGKLEMLKYALGPKGQNVSGELVPLGDHQNVFFAESRAEWHPKWVPAIIRRFEGKSGWAITAFTAAPVGSGESVHIRRLTASRDGDETLPPQQALAVEVVAPEGRYLVLSANASERFVVDGIPMTGPLDAKFERTKTK